MVLTSKQEEGLRIAVQRYNEGQPYTCISGYAGTGKSTLIKYIIAALDVDPETEVAYVAYTGKAAEVLRHKGCANATTAHKLLYKARRLPNGSFKFYPRKVLENDYKVIVVDEISMLPIELWELLLSHKVYILASGDPFQLPPINKESDNLVLRTPHIFLDEIMRQAAESEIIRLTMAIRAQQPIEFFKGNEVQIIDRSELVDGMYDWADQIITATNATRHAINASIRESKGYDLAPAIGDKVICLRNCWDILDGSGSSALVNGTIGYINEGYLDSIRYPVYGLHNKEVPVFNMCFETDLNEKFYDIPVDYTALTTGQKFLTPKEEYLISRNKDVGEPPIEFNYGYAITCHRAQGSEWRKVLVIEERFPFDKEEHARWLYTACTRASDKLVLVR